MDDEATADRIIEQLCLTAGQLMEDSSVAAAMRMPTLPHARRSRIQQLHAAGRDIYLLVAAAEVMFSRSRREEQDHQS